MPLPPGANNLATCNCLCCPGCLCQCTGNTEEVPPDWDYYTYVQPDGSNDYPDNGSGFSSSYLFVTRLTRTPCLLTVSFPGTPWDGLVIDLSTGGPYYGTGGQALEIVDFACDESTFTLLFIFESVGDATSTPGACSEGFVSATLQFTLSACDPMAATASATTGTCTATVPLVSTLSVTLSET